jgi:hypothetical protein
MLLGAAIFFSCHKKDSSPSQSTVQNHCLLQQTLITGISQQDYKYDNYDRLAKAISGKDSAVYDYRSDGSLKLSYTNQDSGRLIPAYVLLSFDKKNRVISAFDFLFSNGDFVQHRSVSCIYDDAAHKIDVTSNANIFGPPEPVHFTFFVDDNGNIVHQQQFVNGLVASELYYSYDDKPNPRAIPDMLNFPESLFPPSHNLLSKTIWAASAKQYTNKLTYKYTYTANGYPETYMLSDSANNATEVGSYVYSCK